MRTAGSRRSATPTARACRRKQDDVILATGEWSFISALGHNVLFPLRNGTVGSIMEDRASARAHSADDRARPRDFAS